MRTFYLVSAVANIASAIACIATAVRLYRRGKYLIVLGNELEKRSAQLDRQVERTMELYIACTGLVKKSGLAPFKDQPLIVPPKPH